MPRDRHLFALALAALALLYAFLAGFRTVGDPDLGWMLATGRFVVQQHSIPSTDVLSYTAAGREWIYPPFAGVIFYALFLAGGYAALSWFAAAASTGTAALVLGAEWGNPVVAGLCALAVPIIAARTAPRANLFTVVLFAAFLNLLWRHYRGRRARLWLLPLLMVAWVNLHLGFIAGLALIAGYALLEAIEMLGGFQWGGPRWGRPPGLPSAADSARASDGRRARPPALARLGGAAPWLLACLPATLVNPWGWNIYRALARQNAMMAPTANLIGEWMGVRLNRAALYDLLLWREPASAYWWLLLAFVAGIGAAAWKRRFGIGLLLAVSALVSFRYVRFQGLFAVAVAVVAGHALWRVPGSAGIDPDGYPSGLPAGPLAKVPVDAELDATRATSRTTRPRVIGAVLFLLFAIFVGIRIADLVTGRYYLASQEITLFGPGASWWYPERAAAFVERERLPGRIFNNYNAGGFLAWRLPGYPVYIDGRSVPFGADLFARYLRVMSEPPDSAEWQREADTRGINTLVLTATRYPALGALDLRQYCESRAWAPVYLDEVSAVFVRNREENRAWIDRLRVDCRRVAFPQPESASRGHLYNFYANAGAALAALGRDPSFAWQRAQSIFARDPYLCLMRGSWLQGAGRPRDAEVEYRRALALREFDEAWFALGQAQAQQGQFEPAAASLRRAAAFSVAPSRIHLTLGQVYLAMNRPALAMDAIQRAERESPWRAGSGEAGAAFRSEIAAGRAGASWLMGDQAGAVKYQEMSAAENPSEPQAWLRLAELYDAVGRPQDGRQARSRARAAAQQAQTQ